jgi:peptidoglycan hydrolase-like protein with peptidoglycan-binding domain
VKKGSLVLLFAAVAGAPCAFPVNIDPGATKPDDLLEDTEAPRARPAAVESWSARSAPERAAEPSLTSTVVTIVRRPDARPIMLHRPSIPVGRDAIGRQLQKELRRVGCYRGQLDGVWTTSTRRAMEEFIDRVNAALPTGQPDGILLALVQSHPNKVCGVPCPMGQGLGAAGRCMPNAILARRTGGSKVAERPVPAISTLTTTIANAAHLPPMAAPDGAAVVGATPLATTTPAPARPPRHAAERQRQSPVSRERSWAQDMLRRGFVFN